MSEVKTKPKVMGRSQKIPANEDSKSVHVLAPNVGKPRDKLVIDFASDWLSRWREPVLINHIASLDTRFKNRSTCGLESQLLVQNALRQLLFQLNCFSELKSSNCPSYSSVFSPQFRSKGKECDHTERKNTKIMVSVGLSWTLVSKMKILSERWCVSVSDTGIPGKRKIRVL